MASVTFEEWLRQLRHHVCLYRVNLRDSDDEHRIFYDCGDTPFGAVMVIRQYGYE
jgi:hypothetical protein